MPVIRVDDEVFKALQAEAEPFVDTPNSVLRRLLDLDSVSAGSSGGGGQPPNVGPGPEGALHTPQSEYRLPIVRALARLGGRAAAAAVLGDVHRQMQGRLTLADRERVPSGADFRWRNSAMWQRKKMVRDGLLRSDSPRGTWEITEHGRRYLAEHGGPA